ncbi:transforming growth factor beta regulator 1-like [Xenopus laevis]|uniref:Transforming growth factor beta regulator 1-like n=1 Tax=Xenopus laevis TaxID=8355 RepID=A0A8J1MFJ2_XENLA|nr:transforming growth factor beta regulator 1-like [Xenopus laevis]
MKFEVCKAGEEQVPCDISESSPSVNFEAFQRQSFEAIKNSNVLTGTLDLPEIHASHDYISTYQEIFLSHSQLASSMQHMKSPSNQYSPSRSSE